jgi:trimeric autotransporter adhesin
MAFVPLGTMKIGQTGEVFSSTNGNDLLIYVHDSQRLRLGHINGVDSFLNISSCNVELKADIVPLLNDVYSIGTRNLRIQDVWCSDYVHVGSASLKSPFTGTLLVMNNASGLSNHGTIAANYFQIGDGSNAANRAVLLSVDSNTGGPSFAWTQVNSEGIVTSFPVPSSFKTLVSGWSKVGTNILADTGATVGIGMSPTATDQLSVSGNIYCSGLLKSQSTIETSGSFATSNQLICNSPLNVAPLVVSNSNLVENLSAQYLDGQPSSFYMNPVNLSGAVPINKGGTNATTLTANKLLVMNTNGTAVTAPTNLHWSSTTTPQRLGVNTSSPSEALHVVGRILASDDITAFSDERHKVCLERIPSALDKLNAINGYTYEWSDESPNYTPENKRRLAGVVAQEVEQVLPEVVYTGNDGTKAVSYGNMVALLIEAIKELKSLVLKDCGVSI